MPKPLSAKKVLNQHNQKQLRRFFLNDDDTLELLAISSIPWISTRKGHKDTYTKNRLPQTGSIVGAEHVSFIQKNGHPEGFLWHTTPEKLQQGVRWGIIKPGSVTGQVISCLGHYRVVAHERIAKGISSNTQQLKLQLVDLYQDRIEALQVLERLVNQANTKEDYKKAIASYKEKVTEITGKIGKLSEDPLLNKINPQALEKIKNDLNNDVIKATNYLNKIAKDKNSLNPYNRARGQHSVLEFVKQQMMSHLYELQGINQDITYSNGREFALTRGELNDYIEDARKLIDDYGTDPRNRVLAAHQGQFSLEESRSEATGEKSNSNGLITYDFTREHLNVNQERQALLAISFIEGWDKVDYSNPKKPTVENCIAQQKEDISIINATRWKNHRNLPAFFRSFGHYLLNVVKSVVLPVKPWEEETWKNKDFHLVAASLREHTKTNEPMWHKPVNFIKSMGRAIVDLFRGIKDFGSNLVIKLPDELLNDWDATKAVLTLEETLKSANAQIEIIKDQESENLQGILAKHDLISEEVEIAPEQYGLANVPYRLTPGEQNDILTALIRGGDEFASVFTHNIFAKDPVAGALFIATYAVGGVAIYFPAVAKAIFGANYVNWFTSFSHTMGSSQFASAAAGGSTQAQAAASLWDLAIHGTTSLTAQAVSNLAEDPLTVAAGFFTAYYIGYVLANGIAGHAIPGVSKALREDLGSKPQTGYPLIGAKVAVGLHGALLKPQNDPYVTVKITYDGEEINYNIQISPEHKKQIDQFRFALWLSNNSEHLTKLNPETLFEISRQIDSLYSKEQAAALKKIIYPESIPSIAYQLFAIPLNYIPALLRITINTVMSLVAWGIERPNPWAPMERSWQAFAHKLGTDLTRLINAASEFAHFAFNGIAAFAKVGAYVIGMTIGRLAGFIGFAPGHQMHKGFAGVHNFFRTVGEFFYPARTVKSVVVAHPASVVKDIEESYGKLLTQLQVDVKVEQVANTTTTTAANESGSSAPLFRPVPADGISQPDGANKVSTSTVASKVS